MALAKAYSSSPLLAQAANGKPRKCRSNFPLFYCSKANFIAIFHEQVQPWFDWWWNIYTKVTRQIELSPLREIRISDALVDSRQGWIVDNVITSNMVLLWCTQLSRGAWSHGDQWLIAICKMIGLFYLVIYTLDISLMYTSCENQVLLLFI